MNTTKKFVICFIASLQEDMGVSLNGGTPKTDGV